MKTIIVLKIYSRSTSAPGLEPCKDSIDLLNSNKRSTGLAWSFHLLYVSPQTGLLQKQLLEKEVIFSEVR